MATPPEQVEARRGITGAQAALALAGLAAVLLLVWLFVLRGGDDELAVDVPPGTSVVTPAPEATEEPVGKGKRPLETFEVFAPKDPFRPLISAAAGGTAATAVGAPAPAASPGTGAPSGGSDISGGAGGGGGGGESVGGHRVRLIDTFRRGGEDQARVQVDGTVYTVGEGDRFAENFEILSISGQCASMLFGDDQFSLCEGEEILK
jgi:hypothetical protein